MLDCFEITADAIEVSDGDHTFEELYEHRHWLWIQLCKYHIMVGGLTDSQDVVWRSKLHSDGTGYDGWFVLGLGSETGKQITYHLPERLWNETGFAKTLEQAPEWDGHSAADVLNRLQLL